MRFGDRQGRRAWLALGLLGVIGAGALGCGGKEKIPLSFGTGVSAATEGGEETLFSFTPAEAVPLLVSVTPEASTLVLDVIDEETGAVITTGMPQGAVRVASWLPTPGVPVCVRVENTAESAYAGVLTIEEAPTATVVNVTTPGGGDGLLVRLTNDLGNDVVNCLARLDMNPGSGTWTFVFGGAEDLVNGPFTMAFSLIDINDPGMMMPSQVLAFGSAPLPVMEGVVNIAAVNLVVTAGMPPPAADCPEPGVFSPLVPVGSYGSSDLR